MTTAQTLPAYIRASAAARARFSRRGDRTYPSQISEQGGLRLRFPKTLKDCEATLINTGGGLCGGDRLQTVLTLEAQTAAYVSTQAAEKVYRSDGEPAHADMRFELMAGANLIWLPQETILFSGAVFRRSLSVEMARDATLLACESVVFGRTAMGESIRSGSMRDRWRIRRGGELVYADEFRIEGDMAAVLSRKAVGGGARAVATLLYVAPDAQSRLDGVRAVLDTASGCEGGASAWNGLLIVRLLAIETLAMRVTLAELAAHMSGRPAPRAWRC